MNIKNKFDKLSVKIKSNFKKDYVQGYEKYLQSENQRGNVLMCYITSPFYISSDSNLFYRHQNFQESVAIANVFNSFGYSVDIVPYNKEIDLEKEYDIIFGFGRSFKYSIDQMNYQTCNIFYGTGMHWDQLNQAEAHRLEELKQRRGVEMPATREVSEKDKLDIKEYSDHVIIIGDSPTVKSYEHILKSNEVYTVSNTSFEFLSDYQPRISSPYGYLWMGSGGLVLRGLDVVIEAFSELKHNDIYICGPVSNNEEFISEYEREIGSDNIHLVGFVELESDKFRHLLNNVCFHLYPSASDSAPPGSVTNTMRAGVVPILSEATTPAYLTNDVETLSEISKSEIKRAVKKTSSIKRKRVSRLSKNFSRIAENKFSIDAFKSKFERTLHDILQ